MTINKVSGSTTAKIFMPTEDQLKTAYGSICQRSIKNKTAKLLKSAPKNFAKYPHYNITPKGTLGVRSEVYVIKGHLMLATTPVVPHAKATWHDCGPMPLF